MTSLWLRPPHPSGTDVSLYAAGRLGFGVRLRSGHTTPTDVVLRPFDSLVLTVAAAQGGGAQSLSYTGIGGALTDGTASVTIALIAAVAGGVITDGAATAARALVAAVSGGALTDGIGAAAKTLVAVPAGGAQTDGAATAVLGLSVTPVGGILTDGAATPTIALAVTPTGGAVTDGVATAARALSVTGAGEAVTSGAADVESSSGNINLSHTGTGGAIAGGAATVTETFAPPIAEPSSGLSLYVGQGKRSRSRKHLVVGSGDGPTGGGPRFAGSATVTATFAADRNAASPAQRPAVRCLSHQGTVRFTPRGTASVSITQRPSVPPPAPIADAVLPSRRRARALALALSLAD